MREVEAIIINVKDYKEFDQIVTIYTQELGKVDLLAKGLKKMTSKNRGGCLLFGISKIRLIYKQNSFSNLLSATSINSHQKIFEDYQTMLFASVMVELYYKLGEHFNDKPYVQLKKYLNLFNNNQNCLLILAHCYLTIFNYLGISPQLNGCVICENKKIVHFSIYQGGFVCSDCLELKNDEDLINVNVLEALYLLVNNKIDDINKIEIDDKIIIQIINLEIDYLANHLDVKFNSYKLINEYL